MAHTDDLSRSLLNYLHLPRVSCDILDGSLNAQLVLSKFTHGQSNPTFLVGTDSSTRRVVLRKKPTGRLPATAHAVEREYMVMSALYKLIPVPRMLLLETDPTHIGTPFFLMEYVQGRMFLDASLPALIPAERRAIYESAVQTLAALHNVKPEAVGLDHFGPQGNYYERQLRRLTSVSLEQATLAPALQNFAKIAAWFDQHMPPTERRICHGDYKLDNMFFARESSEVTAVLDWELSTLGHPISDVANFCLIYIVPPLDEAPHPGARRPRGMFGGVSGLLGLELGLDTVGVPTEEEVLRMYCAAAARPYPEPHWVFAKAFVLVKMAVIAQGVASRALRGTASDLSASASAVAASAALLMDMALATAGIEASENPEMPGAVASAVPRL